MNNPSTVNFKFGGDEKQLPHMNKAFGGKRIMENGRPTSQVQRRAQFLKKKRPETATMVSKIKARIAPITSSSNNTTFVADQTLN